jgi:GT2 family glycosyltransferase
MRVDWRKRSLDLTLRLADALQRRAYKLPASMRLARASAAAPALLPADPLKAAATALSAARLEAFLSSGAELVLPTQSVPEVSVLLVTFNRAELTFECLQSLCLHGGLSQEVVIVDNASTDGTGLLLDRVRGATVLRNEVNTHFLAGANLAARQARGRHLLFLNNDVRLLPGSIESALRTLQGSPSIGAVGGRIILLDGTLQEAGSIVWNDGSCLGYGRGGDPHDPPYMFARDVDFCSGAFLLTPRPLFEAAGGFDPDFSPAYGEEADYCLKLWERGLRVVYDPDAVMLHYEFASSASPAEAIRLQGQNRETLRRKHRARLRADHHPLDASRVLVARSHHDRARRTLFVDDRIPRATFGSGSPRTRWIISSLLDLGRFVTFYPLTEPVDGWTRVRRTLPREVEVMLGYGAARFADFLGRRHGYYDVLLVSRPHNMAFVNELRAARPELFSGLRVIYDAEAIYSLRQVAGRRLHGDPITAGQADALLREELDLARGADQVIAVSDAEAEAFRGHGLAQVAVLGHALASAPTPRTFADRNGFLFVGSVHEPTSPNADSLRWFIGDVWPQIESMVTGARFDVAGENHAQEIRGLANGAVRMLGPVEELASTYDSRRVFVAPTRFAAGIPHKVHEAAAHGLPVVATPLIADQLGWRDGTELLTAETPRAFAERCAQLHGNAALWAELRENALRRVEKECSPDLFLGSLRRILQGDRPTT